MSSSFHTGQLREYSSATSARGAWPSAEDVVHLPQIARQFAHALDHGEVVRPVVEEGVGRAVVVEVEDLRLARQAGEGPQLDRRAIRVARDVAAQRRLGRPGSRARPVHQQRVQFHRHARVPVAAPVLVESQRHAAQLAELKRVDPPRQRAVVVDTRAGRNSPACPRRAPVPPPSASPCAYSRAVEWFQNTEDQ